MYDNLITSTMVFLRNDFVLYLSCIVAAIASNCSIVVKSFNIFRSWLSRSLQSLCVHAVFDGVYDLLYNLRLLCITLGIFVTCIAVTLLTFGRMI